MKTTTNLHAVFFLSMILFGSLGCTSGEPELITLPSEFASLEAREAAKGISTRIEAYVTNYDPHARVLYIHDGRSGLEVSLNHVDMASYFVPGIKVRVEGETGLSAGRPVLTKSKVTISGKQASLPAPDFAGYPSELQKLSWRSQWVKLAGVVRRVYWENGEIQTLELTNNGQKFKVRLMRDYGFEAKSFLNQYVLVTGVNITEIPVEGEPGMATVSSYSADWIEFDEQAKATAGRELHIPVARLPEADSIVRSGRRVLLRGSIAEKTKTSILLRDSSGELEVPVYVSDNILRGDQVEVKGFLSLEPASRKLESISVREINDYSSIEMIRSVPELFGISIAEADAGRPVRVEGQIALIEVDRGFGYILGDPNGLLFRFEPDSLRSLLNPGDTILIEGFSEAGTFTNAIRDATLSLIEKGSLPDPLLSDVSLLKNEVGAQWVKVGGIVQGVGLDDRLGAFLYIRKADNLFRVELDYNGPYTDLKKYVNSKVEVRGISTSLTNNLGQTIGFMLYSPGAEFIEITHRPEIDSFEMEVIFIKELLTSQDKGGNNHRVHVKGVITNKLQENDLYIQSNGSGILVNLEGSSDRLTVGDEIRISGFVDNYQGHAKIDFAEVQKIGSGVLPEAVKLSARRDMCSSYNAKFVTTEGHLEQIGSERNSRILTLKNGSHSFDAVLPDEGLGYPEFELGSRIQVSGVCKNILELSLGLTPETRGSEILLSSPDNLLMLAPPEGFTLKLLQKVLSILTLILIGALIWVTLLKRRVGIQTGVISAKLAIEEKLRTQAQIANRIKSQFLANMSHEIRTPLTSILGFSELIGESGDSHTKNLASMIGRSGTRLMDTINSVLDVAQLDNDDINLRLSALDLEEFLLRSLSQFEQKAKEKGLGLTYLLQGDKKPIILSNESALERILYNLLNNAIRFTERGKISITIGTDEKSVYLKCADEGIGISEEFLPFVFESFRQESTGEGRLFEGNGLGLAIVKKLTELMKGSVEAESTLGQGSVFTIRFPRIDLEAIEDEIISSKEAKELLKTQKNIS